MFPEIVSLGPIVLFRSLKGKLGRGIDGSLGLLVWRIVLGDPVGKSHRLELGIILVLHECGLSTVEEAIRRGRQIGIGFRQGRQRRGILNPGRLYAPSARSGTPRIYSTHWCRRLEKAKQSLRITRAREEDGALWGQQQIPQAKDVVVDDAGINRLANGDPNRSQWSDIDTGAILVREREEGLELDEVGVPQIEIARRGIHLGEGCGAQVSLPNGASITTSSYQRIS